MTEAEKARRLRASSNFRSRKADQGETQVQLWIPEELKEKLDQVIEAGRFKNRSEATAAALERLLDGTTMN